MTRPPRPATTLQPATAADRTVFERLWQLYRHDLSSYRGMLPGPDGLFRLGHLPDHFADDPDRRAYLVRSGDDLAGFALVRGLSEPPRSVAEFFVLRAVRRRVGYDAAALLLTRYPPPWEIGFQEENPGAGRFWRRVTADDGRDWHEESRPVPDTAWLPPDRFLVLPGA